MIKLLFFFFWDVIADDIRLYPVPNKAVSLIDAFELFQLIINY